MARSFFNGGRRHGLKELADIAEINLHKKMFRKNLLFLTDFFFLGYGSVLHDFDHFYYSYQKFFSSNQSLKFEGCMLNEYSGRITPIAGKLTNGTGRIRDRVIFCVPEKFFFRYFAKKKSARTFLCYQFDYEFVFFFPFFTSR
jgi:hypothetical protein